VFSLFNVSVMKRAIYAFFGGKKVCWKPFENIHVHEYFLNNFTIY
jgi:hypothetical protein